MRLLLLKNTDIYSVKVFMKKVIIQPGCITCGMCEFISPEVFEVTDICHVRQVTNIAQHDETIKQAVSACPVQVISYTDAP